MTLIVLWEDSRTPGSASSTYGPHALLCACIADQLVLGDHWYAVRTGLDKLVKSVPRSGISKLLADVDEDVLYAGGQHVIAVYDEDKAHRYPELALAARESLERRRRLRILPIGPNVEALVETLRSSGGQVSDDDHRLIVAKSAGGRALTARDRVLNGHARDESQRAIRAELMRRADAWRALVELSATIVGAAVATVG